MTRELWRWPHPHSSSFTLRYAIKSLFGGFWVAVEAEYTPGDILVGIEIDRPDVGWHRALDVRLWFLPWLCIKVMWRRQSPIQLKSNFRHYIREERYRIECAIYGEDEVARRWFAGADA